MEASENSTPLPSVARLGSYILDNTVGRGSFGKVKLATHLPSGEQVAIKVINNAKFTNHKSIRKIKREIKILKLFQHPHIVRLYEVVPTQSDIFLVQEYASGGELYDHIVSHGKFSEAQARYYFQQLISGVEYCHHFRVVHRDLKPENLLLDAAGDLKLIDFGLSNLMRDGDFLATSCGSPNYAAPEVISGKLYAGPEVDVWSCGIILFALLCGHLPFDEESIPALFNKIKKGIFTVPGYVSPAAHDLLLSMLQVDPLKRLTTVQIRQHAWFIKSLPTYLNWAPRQWERLYEELDMTLVQRVAEVLRISVEHVTYCLTDRIDGEVSVTYCILRDRQQQQKLATSRSPREFPTISATARVEPRDTVSDPIAMKPPIRTVPRSSSLASLGGVISPKGKGKTSPSPGPSSLYPSTSPVMHALLGNASMKNLYNNALPEAMDSVPPTPSKSNPSTETTASQRPLQPVQGTKGKSANPPSLHLDDTPPIPIPQHTTLPHDAVTETSSTLPITTPLPSPYSATTTTTTATPTTTPSPQPPSDSPSSSSSSPSCSPSRLPTAQPPEGTNTLPVPQPHRIGRDPNNSSHNNDNSSQQQQQQQQQHTTRTPTPTPPYPPPYDLLGTRREEGLHAVLIVVFRSTTTQ